MAALTIPYFLDVLDKSAAEATAECDDKFEENSNWLKQAVELSQKSMIYQT